jgi:hypothetical protein
MSDDDDPPSLPTVDADELDEDNYLSDEFRECPEHGDVIPIALPYVSSGEQMDEWQEPDGYHLVCPRCRHFFTEYEPSNQQWMSR